jgi:hypothetical protein
MARTQPPMGTLWPALALLAGLLMPFAPVNAEAPGHPGVGDTAGDDTCVGKGEYKAIKRGMTIEKLAQALDGQTPFADVEAKGKQRVRWYAACDDWQPEKDVAVRYHQPVVGRRTVTKKSLAVYVAPTP